MRKFINILILVFVATTVGANPLVKIYQVDDPILQYMQELSLESGINSVSSSGPVTGYEVLRNLDAINYASLSTHSQHLYDKVEKALNTPFKFNDWNFSITITQEGYVNTNSNFNYFEWEEKYNDRPPFLHAETEAIFMDHGYGIFSMAVQKTFDQSDFSKFNSNNPLFLHGDNSTLDKSVPHTAFLGFSGQGYSIIGGRDALKIGRGSTGNLLLGDHAIFHDFLQLNLSNKKLRYSLLVIPMNELITGEIQNKGYSGALGEGWYPRYNEAGAWATLFFGTRRRTQIFHRLEMDILPNLRISATESTLFYTDILDLRMFSPVMFMHNWGNFGEVNNSIGLDFEITLSRRWALEVQLFLDQFQTKGEQDTDSLPPNAYAFLLGSRYRYPFKNWILSGFIEGVYTSPFAYLRTGDQTHNYDENNSETQFNLDFVHVANVWDNGISGVQWLGYKYGPDSIVIATEIKAKYKELFTLSSTLRFMAQGERGLKIEEKEQSVEMVSPEQINMASPSGEDPTYRLIIGVGAHYTIPKTQITLSMRNYWLHRWQTNQYESGYQLGLGLAYSY